MTTLKKLHLILYFTDGMSLQDWASVGMLDREVGHYLALLPYVSKITFVTYGDAQDLTYSDALGGIEVVCNRWGFSPRIYKFIISWVYPLFWQKPWVAKSNQMYGAPVGLAAAKRFGQKFLARAGYLPSNIMIWFDGEAAPKTQQILEMEHKAFFEADACMVTVESMRETLVERYGVAREKIRVIPNAIDIETFRVIDEIESQPKHIYFVGRLREEKNVQAIIEAVEGLDVVLHIIGNGDWRTELEALVEEKKLPVKFLGNIPNHKLPEYLNRGDIFVLASHLEHHPKALLEAMACGRAVVGTNVMGINDIIRHEENGLLCEVDALSIRNALERLLHDVDLRKRLGVNARAYVVEHCAHERVTSLELALLKELI